MKRKRKRGSIVLALALLLVLLAAPASGEAGARLPQSLAQEKALIQEGLLVEATQVSTPKPGYMKKL